MGQQFSSPAGSRFSHSGVPRQFSQYWSRKRPRAISYKGKFTRKHTYGAAPRGAEAKAYDAYDAANVGFGVTNVANFFALNLVTEGTSWKTRVGSRIKMKSIDLHIWPYWAASASATAGGVSRIMLVYDGQPNGAYPATADLLKSSVPSTTACSPVNLDNRDRFLVLREFYMVEPSTTTPVTTASNVGSDVAAQVPCHVIHWFVKLKAIEAIYKASAGAITDIASGALLLVTVTEGTTTGYGLSVSSRLRFYD